MERGNNCEICNKVLIERDHAMRSSLDFLYTCEKHNKYADYPKLEVAKKAAGFKYFKLKNIKCEICDKPHKISLTKFKQYAQYIAIVETKSLNTVNR